MNKAFLFDFDGIFVNNEPLWEEIKPELYTKCFGAEITAKLGPTIGSNLHAIHERAKKLGSSVSFETVHNEFLTYAPQVYSSAPLTPHLDKLLSELRKQNYKIGIVSASLTDWIEIVLQRMHLSLVDFDIVISLFERDDLQHKPEPDGYLYAMKQLNASPESTLIIEDSNTGIASAKASGATVIGFKQNLIKGYKQEGADVYADSIEDVIKIVKASERETSPRPSPKRRGRPRIPSPFRRRLG